MGQQRYVSRELTHFIGRALLSNEERYALLLKILRGGWLTHPPHKPEFVGNLRVNHLARFSTNEMYSPQVVCFCDIPVQDLDIHVRKYGPFGIAFSKAVLIDRGANPVFYVASPTRIHNRSAASDLMDRAREPANKLRESLDQTIELGAAFDRALPEWHSMTNILTYHLRQSAKTKEAQALHDLRLFMEFQVFSFIKFFDPSLDDSHHENFYMEREWRVVGNVQFELSDISRVLLPQEFAQRLRADVPEYAGQVDFLI